MPGKVKLTEFEAKEKARLLLGFKRPNADVLVAINCAWEMGARQPYSLAEIARGMLIDLSSGRDD